MNHPLISLSFSKLFPHGSKLTFGLAKERPNPIGKPLDVEQGTEGQSILVFLGLLQYLGEDDIVRLEDSYGRI